MRPSFQILMAAAGYLLVACFLPTIAEAKKKFTDAKTLPGILCRPVEGTGGTPEFGPDATVHNSSTTEALEVVCPVVRDNTQTKGGWEARISVIQTGAPVDCTASSHEETEGVVVDDLSVSSSGGFAAEDITIAVGDQDKEGYSTIRCLLPPVNLDAGPARLIMYRIMENVKKKDPKTDSKSYTGAFTVHGFTFDLNAQAPFLVFNQLGFAIRANPDFVQAVSIPLVRDVVAESWDRIRVRVFDEDPEPSQENDVSCAFTTYFRDGTFLAPGLAGNIAEESEGFTEVVLEAPKDLLATDGPYALRCFLPEGASAVVSYDMRER